VVELAQAVEWHRQVAALVAAADRVGVAEKDLPAVRARLLSQQARFAQAAARTGSPLPALAPTPTEIAAATPALGDLSSVAVAETFRTNYSTLDAVDSILAAYLASAAGADHVPVTPIAGPTGTPTPTTATMAPAPAVTVAGPAPSGVSRWPASARNALVYGGYAFAVLVVQVLLLAVADAEQTLPLLAPVCLLVLPAFAWAAGWFTIGVAFRSPPGWPKVKRTPRLGAIVCLLPNLLLCAGLGVLLITR
jgi:hypothetical protein